jgi:hypothetical protein
MTKFIKQLKAALRAFREPDAFEQALVRAMIAESEVSELWLALDSLVDDVENAVDFGMPWSDPENNFHVSMMASYTALKRKPAS